MDYTRFINETSSKRIGDPIREIVALQAYDHGSGSIFLTAGVPHEATLPYKSLAIGLEDETTLTLKGSELVTALSYSPTLGYPPLAKYLKDFTKKYHSPPHFDKREILVTSGGQDGLAKIVDMVMEPEDYIITHEPFYAGTFVMTMPYAPKYIAVPCDADGMVPSLLRKALSRWDPKQMSIQRKGVPKLMYLNPNACNPSGISFSAERKREIYEIACQYNILILEDDPYYFVQFKDIKDYAPSFLEMDVEGRVVRFDSFSKLLSSGMRIGFATGPKPLIERINYHIQASSLQASTLCQAIIYRTMENFGEQGYVNHVKNIRSVYEERRDLTIVFAEKYLKGLCEWNVPAGGFFMWIKVKDVKDTYEMVIQRGLLKKVIVLPGKYFMADQSLPCSFVRLSYCSNSIEDIEEGIQKFAELIKEEIQINGTSV